MEKILLLEDDLNLIEGLKYSLSKNGYSVECYRTVNDIFEHMHCIDKYQLLLLDVTLPDGTGFEVWIG